MIIHFSFINC